VNLSPFHLSKYHHIDLHAIILVAAIFHPDTSFVAFPMSSPAPPIYLLQWCDRHIWRMTTCKKVISVYFCWETALLVALYMICQREFDSLVYRLIRYTPCSSQATPLSNNVWLIIRIALWTLTSHPPFIIDGPETLGITQNLCQNSVILTSTNSKGSYRMI